MKPLLATRKTKKNTKPYMQYTASKSHTRDNITITKFLTYINNLTGFF